MQIQDKIPRYGQFLKNPIHVVAYVLLLYFVYKEFTRGDECKDLRMIIEKQEKRISKLEEANEDLVQDNKDFVNALMVKNGIIDKVTTKLDSIKKETQ